MSLNGALWFCVDVKLKCGDLLMFSVASLGMGCVRRRAVMLVVVCVRSHQQASV